MDNKPLFSLGQVVQTRGLYSMTEANPDRHNEVVTALHRYMGGDWGNTCQEDAELNNEAVRSGQDRIVAKYCLSFANIFIITEWDRSYTTILLCEEY